MKFFDQVEKKPFQEQGVFTYLSISYHWSLSIPLEN